MLFGLELDVSSSAERVWVAHTNIVQGTWKDMVPACRARKCRAFLQSMNPGHLSRAVRSRRRRTSATSMPLALRHREPTSWARRHTPKKRDPILFPHAPRMPMTNLTVAKRFQVRHSWKCWDITVHRWWWAGCWRNR